jgi:hypothetical protein
MAKFGNMVFEPSLKDEYGRFVRIHHEWSLDNFNDGYINDEGRFKVYLPNHHRAQQGGYVLRSIVAYEAYTGDIVTKDFVIHHINGNKCDDSDGNLFKMLIGEHQIMHHSLHNGKDCVCEICGKEFYVKRYKITYGSKKGHNIGRFCSNGCYNVWRANK